MARITKPLTALQINKAKGKEKVHKLMDGGGLYLQITPNGSKSWRLRYRVNGKEHTMALGAYPAISLDKARDLRNAYRVQIAMGIDPLKEKEEIKAEQQRLSNERSNTLYWVSLHYFIWKKKSGEMNPVTLDRLIRRFGADFLEDYGDKPLIDITVDDIKAVLLVMHTRGAKESSRRFYTQLLFFYDWALHSGYMDNNTTPISMISKKHLLPMDKTKKQNYPIIDDPKLLGELLRDIDNAPCEYPVRQMLKVLPHLIVRPKNIREMTWNEIDLEKKLWIIPAHKMKMGITHIVPLTDYVIEVLKETRDQWSYDKELVFASYRTLKVVSDNTPNTCLKRIKKGKWKGKIVTHSFRGIFSTFANNDLQWNSKVIEAVLAHGLSNEVEKAYNRADYLEERKKIHKWWTDYLLELKNQP